VAAPTVRLKHPSIGEIQIALTKGGLVLGRGHEADVNLSWDASVSRRHARIVLRSGSVWIEDLQSHNGTWVLGARVDAVAMQHGTPVSIGETQLELSSSLIDDLPAAETTDLPGRAAAPEIDEPHTPTLEAPPPEIPPPAHRTRTEPRLVANDRVEIVAEGREELKELWLRDISKGGVFVKSDTPPRVGERLRVRIQTSDGMIELRALVVHAIDPVSAKLMGTAPGAGLQFVDLLPEQRSALQRYVDGIARTLDDGQSGPPAPSGPDAEKMLLRARTFLEHVEKNDLYAALEVKPNAPEPEIDLRVKELRESFSAALAVIGLPRGVRLERAISTLEKIGPVMLDRLRRLQYDLRTGHIRAEERLSHAAAGGTPTAEELRRAWQLCAPDRMGQAATSAREAMLLRQKGQIPEAMMKLKEAIVNDPFSPELRPMLRAWEEHAKAAR
jgi:hypothetical protein